MAAIHYEATYPAPVDRIMSVLTDEAFLSAYAQEVGALTHRVWVEREDGSVRTRLAMTVPTTGVPAVLKRLVTPTIDLLEVRTWAFPGDPDRRHGLLAVDASARGRDAKVRGRLLLEPGGGDAATRFGVDGEAKVKVPLVGDLAAELVRDLVGSVIKRQSAVMDRWLRES